MELDDTQAAPERTHTQPRSAVAARPELAAGRRLGHFRIEKKLGAGGMGEVYLATDLALDRPVAIKVLPGGGTEAGRDRLVREARAQARVIHPNVGHIYFIGEDDGLLYFAMEYIAGTTLAEKVGKAPLPVEEALATIRAAALGLREAQRMGFLHRDVKPSNLMVDAHGAVKVVDFGLAAGAPERVADGPVEQTTMAGTPLYMAPEQARGEPVDLRADIYALGATLYHLVSGKPPFEAASVAELLTLHQSAERPVLPKKSQARMQINALDALIARMMAPDPADRFASYDELIRAIELISVVHTRPAGIWVRTTAFAIDIFLCMAVFAVGSLPFGGMQINVPDNALPLYVAYSTLALWLWGTTAGKALLELEVVATATGRRPGIVRAALRQLVMLGIPLAMWIPGRLLEGTAVSGPMKIAGFALGNLAILSLIHAALRVSGKRAPWDRLAGTIERYRVR